MSPPRLGAILALATLAFAMMFESIFVPLDWVGGGQLPTRVPRPGFLVGDRSFLFFALGMLVVVAIGVILVRKGTTGRYLEALRGSEADSSRPATSSRKARAW